MHPATVAAICKHITTIESIPDLDGFIITARGNTRAIRRPGHRLHPIPVTTINSDAIAIGGIPNAHRLIVARRGDMRSPWRPRDSRHTAGMAAADKARISLRLWQFCLFGYLGGAGSCDGFGGW